MAEKKEKQLAKSEPNELTSLIEKAIQAQTPIEVMERLFALQQQYKADKAREAFVQAKSNFQAEVPVIYSDKIVKNKDGQSVRYRYASLGHIASQIKESLAKHNLSYSWDVVHEDKHMKVACTLMHSAGHSDKSNLEIPISSDQYMTEPQKYASSQTYAKRYTLINVLGLATADEDTDATDVGKEKDAKSVKSKIILRLRALGYPAKEKEEIQKAVMQATGMKLEEKNYAMIADKLEQKVREAQENEEIPVIEE